MPRGFVDLSIRFEDDMLSDAPPFAPGVDLSTDRSELEETSQQLQLTAGCSRVSDMMAFTSWLATEIEVGVLLS